MSNISDLTSQCASRKVITCPLTEAAPSKRALIKPERFPVRRTK